MSNTSRDFSVDALKGFAIACVVLGHVLLRNLISPNDSDIYLLLTAFEMPLFMFLSGYVLAGRIRSPRFDWWKDRALRLMTVFVVWHTIFFVTNNWESFATLALWPGVSGLASYLSRTVASPTSGLWYLPALVIASGVLAMLVRSPRKPLLLAVVGLLAIEAVVDLQRGVAPGMDFGLAKVQTFWPAFAGGWVWGVWGKKLSGSKSLPMLIAAVLYVPVAIYGMEVVGTMGEYTARLTKAALGLGGVAVSATLMAWAEPIARAIRLDRLGQLTLGIYCAHWLFLRVEFGPSPAQIVLGFLFTLTAAGLTSWGLDRSAVLRAALLGGWRKATQRKPLHP